MYAVLPLLLSVDPMTPSHLPSRVSTPDGVTPPEREMTMKYKAALMGFIAAGAVFAPLMPVVAHAETSIQYAPTTIEAAGEQVSSPQHIVATDPWSGKPTSWVPLWYLQQALKMEGASTTWNGNTLDITSVPHGWDTNVSDPPQAGTPPAGQMQFSIEGNQNDFVRAPTLVADAPYMTTPTTYVPVYYADLFLRKRLLMGVAWQDTTWSMASPQNVNTILMTVTPSTVNVGQSVTISGEYRLVGGLGGPDVQLQVTGLPSVRDKTISTDSEGKFSFTTTFKKTGTHTVIVGNAEVSRQGSVTVK